MVLFCLSHTSEHPPPPPRPTPKYLLSCVNFSKMWHWGAIHTLPSLCFVRKPFPLHGSLFRKFHVLHSIHLPSLGLLSILIWVCNYTLHILATAYFSRPLRESSKPEEQIQMVLSLASSIQNSRWQDFIWKRTRLTQHLFLLTSHFYDQRFWSFPPLLSRKNTTPELHGKRLSIIWGKYLICFHRHAEEDSLAVRS